MSNEFELPKLTPEQYQEAIGGGEAPPVEPEEIVEPEEDLVEEPEGELLDLDEPGDEEGVEADPDPDEEPDEEEPVGDDNDPDALPEKWDFKGVVRGEERSWEGLTKEDIVNKLQIAEIATQNNQEAGDIRRRTNEFATNLLNPETAIPELVKLWSQQMGVDEFDAEEALWDSVLRPAAQRRVEQAQLSEADQRAHERERRAEAKMAAAEAQRVANHATQVVSWVKEDLAAHNLSMDDLDTDPELVNFQNVLAAHIKGGETIGREALKQAIGQIASRAGNPGKQPAEPKDVDVNKLLDDPESHKKVMAELAKRQKINQAKSPRTPSGQGKRRRPKAEGKPRSYTATVDFFRDR